MKVIANRHKTDYYPVQVYSCSRRGRVHLTGHGKRADALRYARQLQLDTFERTPVSVIVATEFATVLLKRAKGMTDAHIERAFKKEV